MSELNEINDVWNILITRQEAIVKNRACDEFMHGLTLLDLPKTRMPSIKEVSDKLECITGFTLEPVPEIISYDSFFELLSQRKFPCTTFLRTKEQLDYLKEPDVFHEIFGHCPLLTNPAYADFTHNYGKLGIHATHEERVLLARLYWFTVEFGLINTTQGVRAYGGGILSSPKETVYSIESDVPERRKFDVNDALRTSYQIDVIQPIYYVLDNFNQLYDLINMDLMKLVKEVHLAESEPKFPC
ncbi:MAG TPA: phenylalanine 4-monooxygenase [Gammaproteobacteria bacterium]|nr:phenylalanine 4-monooxygenase [Gammaproteobacteria bacterium]